MKKEGWELLIVRAVRNFDRGNKDSLERLALYLEETDMAIQVLRNKGYGWTGLGILETVQAIERTN